MAPQKKRPGSAVAWPLTRGAPVAFKTPFASGSRARRSGRNPVARMIASKPSSGDCLEIDALAGEAHDVGPKLDPSIAYGVERADLDKRHAPVLRNGLERSLCRALQAELFG